MLLRRLYLWKKIHVQLHWFSYLSVKSVVPVCTSQESGESVQTSRLAWYCYYTGNLISPECLCFIRTAKLQESSSTLAPLVMQVSYKCEWASGYVCREMGGKSNLMSAQLAFKFFFGS